MVEPHCPGAVDRYIDLSGFYDRPGLQSLKEQLQTAFSEYQSHYKRVYRCLGAAGELRRDMSELLAAPAVQQKLAKRAAGIISRELKKPAGGDGRADQRFLSAVTHKGPLTLWGTVEAQAGRVYELADSSGLAHHLLNPILTAGLAAGHRAVACPDPMAPDRLAHVLFPDLALAFVSSSPEQPWPHRAYRRLRLDAMADSDACRAAKPRLRFNPLLGPDLKNCGTLSPDSVPRIFTTVGQCTAFGTAEQLQPMGQLQPIGQNIVQGGRRHAVAHHKAAELINAGGTARHMGHGRPGSAPLSHLYPIALAGIRTDIHLVNEDRVIIYADRAGLIRKIQGFQEQLTHD